MIDGSQTEWIIAVINQLCSSQTRSIRADASARPLDAGSSAAAGIEQKINDEEQMRKHSAAIREASDQNLTTHMVWFQQQHPHAGWGGSGREGGGGGEQGGGGGGGKATHMSWMSFQPINFQERMDSGVDWIHPHSIPEFDQWNHPHMAPPPPAINNVNPISSFLPLCKFVDFCRFYSIEIDSGFRIPESGESTIQSAHFFRYPNLKFVDFPPFYLIKSIPDSGFRNRMDGFIQLN